MDLRINNGAPEWSARGADSWNPFSSFKAVGVIGCCNVVYKSNCFINDSNISYSTTNGTFKFTFNKK